MIHIYVACCNSNSFENIVNYYIRYMPSELVQKMNAFKFEQDSHRFLLGKLLIIKGIERLGYTDLTLKHLCLGKFNKPYFACNNSLNFNISHSGDYVICAISERYRVGIDLEKIRHIDLMSFTKCFTKKEWVYINGSNNPTQEFYRFWTRKEAVIKADGRGLHIPLLNFEVIKNWITIEADRWYVNEIAIADEYVAHLATDGKTRNKYIVQHLVF